MRDLTIAIVVVYVDVVEIECLFDADKDKPYFAAWFSVQRSRCRCHGPPPVLHPFQNLHQPPSTMPPIYSLIEHFITKRPDDITPLVALTELH
jgi:hypothetical protein